MGKRTQQAKRRLIQFLLPNRRVWSDSYKRLSRVWQKARSGEIGPDEAPRNVSFEHIREVWGVPRDEIVRRSRSWRLGAVAFFCIALAGLVEAGIALHGGAVMMLSALCLLVVGTSGGLAYWWRAQVLAKRQFIPFFDWLRGARFR